METRHGRQHERGRFLGVVRPLVQADIVSLRPILETWIRNGDTDEVIRKEVDDTLAQMALSISGQNDRTYFVAEENGSVLGVMGLRPIDPPLQQFVQTPRPIELVNAFVSRDHREGRGVGKALISYLEAYALSHGYTEIDLSSGPRYEKTGWEFYTRVGYVHAGVMENYFDVGRHAQVWRKDLASMTSDRQSE